MPCPHPDDRRSPFQGTAFIAKEIGEHMVWPIRGGNHAGGVALPGSDLLLAQALTKPERAQPTAKPAPAARTAQMTLGGHPVTATPLGAPSALGQTLYEVQWRGVTVRTAFTG